MPATERKESISFSKREEKCSFTFVERKEQSDQKSRRQVQCPREQRIIDLFGRPLNFDENKSMNRMIDGHINVRDQFSIAKVHLNQSNLFIPMPRRGELLVRSAV